MQYAFQTQQQLYFILEYANSGDLFEHIIKRGCFSIDEVRLFMAEIVNAIEHLSAQKKHNSQGYKIRKHSN